MSAAPVLQPGATVARIGAEIRVPRASVALERQQAALRAFRRRSHEYDAAIRAGRRPYGVAEYVEHARIDGDDFVFPRGAAGLVRELLAPVRFVDESIAHAPLAATLIKPLYGEQAALVELLTRFRSGIWLAPVGAGKTIMGVAVIVRVDQPAIVIAPTVDIAAQWRSAFATFGGIDAGLLADGVSDIRRVTVATPQSSLKNIELIRHRFGVVLVDEVHRAASSSMGELLAALPCRYRYGCTATDMRADGDWPVVEWRVGPVRGRIEQRELAASGRVVAPTYRGITTAFEFPDFDPERYQELQAAIVADPARNKLIADTVAAAHTGDAVALVLTGRILHAQELADALVARGLRAHAIWGTMRPKKSRAALLERARAHDVDVLVATTIADEGLDCPSIGRVFLAYPGRSEGRLVQRVGRAVRAEAGKTSATVYDFIDARVGVLAYQANVRAGAFRRAFGGHS